MYKPVVACFYACFPSLYLSLNAYNLYSTDRRSLAKYIFLVKLVILVAGRSTLWAFPFRSYFDIYLFIYLFTLVFI